MRAFPVPLAAPAVAFFILPALMALDSRSNRLPAPSMIEIKVLQGAGAVHWTGSRSTVPLVVQVVDSAGKPVAGAAVSFLMPGAGPAGVFANNMSTEVLITGKDGKATVRGIRWGPEPGQVAIRVVAVKGSARAGTLITQTLEPPAERREAGSGGSAPVSVSKPRGKWTLLGVIAAGAAVGGLVLGLAGGGVPPAGTAPPPAVTQPQSVQVGAPTITIQKP